MAAKRKRVDIEATDFCVGKFEEDLCSYLQHVSTWWDTLIEKVGDWNLKIQQNLPKPELFAIEIHKPQIPNAEMIKELYNSKIGSQMRKKIIGVMLDRLYELGNRVSTQLSSYQKICEIFYNVVIEIPGETGDAGTEYTKVKTDLEEVELGDVRHSLVEDIELFSTAEGKLDFLQGYVTKYEKEFDIPPFVFNNLSVELSEELEQKELLDEPGNQDKAYVNVPEEVKWTEIPVYGIETCE